MNDAMEPIESTEVEVTGNITEEDLIAYASLHFKFWYGLYMWIGLFGGLFIWAFFEQRTHTHQHANPVLILICLFLPAPFFSSRTWMRWKFRLKQRYQPVVNFAMVFSEESMSIIGTPTKIYSWDTFMLAWERDQFYILIPETWLRFDLPELFYSHPAFPIPKRLISPAQEAQLRNLLTRKIGPITTKGRYIETIRQANRQG